MILRSDFGWVIFVAFLFWIFRILQAGARTGRRGPAPPSRLPSGPPDSTQREGSDLEELLRQLEGRLGGRSAGTSEPRPKIVAKRPEARPVPARPEPVRPVPADKTLVSLKAPVDRAAETEALEQTRLAAAAAPAAVRRRSPQTLRDAVLWQEILGPPKGLQ